MKIPLDYLDLCFYKTELYDRTSYIKKKKIYKIVLSVTFDETRDVFDLKELLLIHS